MNKDELETVFDLLVQEDGGGGGIYFFMAEDNVVKKMQLPWVSFCTDEDAYKTSGLMTGGLYITGHGLIVLADKDRHLALRDGIGCGHTWLGEHEKSKQEKMVSFLISY